MFNNQVPLIYFKILTNKLNLSYLKKSKEIKKELSENINSQGIFFITLNA
jgi:hypothetical protein